MELYRKEHDNSLVGTKIPGSLTFFATCQTESESERERERGRENAPVREEELARRISLFPLFLLFSLSLSEEEQRYAS